MQPATPFRDSRRQSNRISAATVPAQPTTASVLAELADVGLSFLDAINICRTAADAVQIGAIDPAEVAPALAVVRHQAREAVYRAQLLDAVVRQRSGARLMTDRERQVLATLAASTHRPASR